MCVSISQNDNNSLIHIWLHYRTLDPHLFFVMAYISSISSSPSSPSPNLSSFLSPYLFSSDLSLLFCLLSSLCVFCQGAISSSSSLHFSKCSVLEVKEKEAQEITECVPGQPGLYSETLSRKKKQNKTKKKKKRKKKFSYTSCKWENFKQDAIIYS